MLVSCFVFVVFLIVFWVLQNKLSYDAFEETQDIFFHKPWFLLPKNDGVF